MAPGFDVIVCGSLHLDIVVRAPALPRIDETAVGSAWHKVCGGKGGNQALQAAQAGARTAMIGCVGRDDFGETLLANLRRAGVDTHGVTVDAGAGSGMSVAILQDDGEYGAVIVSGSNTRIAPSSLAPLWQEMAGARVLVLQNEVPHPVNVTAAAVARAHGAQVVFNAAPARQVDAELLRNVDVLIVNRVEAEALCGRTVSDRASARGAIDELRSLAGAVVITLGGEGLVVAEADGLTHEIAPVPVRVTSTHGAGDCFVGVLAVQLAAGASLMQACEMANARAAAFVSRPL